MKRLVPLCALFLAAGSISAATALAQPSPKATGDVGAETATQAFTAQFVGQGSLTDAKGNYSIQFTRGSLAGQNYSGQVTCYTQSGNVGTLAGPVVDTNNSTITFIRITVQDNGEGSKASGPDQIQVQRFASAPPVSSQCRTPDPPSFATVTDGNLQVH